MRRDPGQPREPPERRSSRSTRWRLLPILVPVALLGLLAAQADKNVGGAGGSCFVFDGVKDKTIENLVIGPCAGHGIELRNSRNVVIRNVTIDGTQGSGIYIYESQEIEVAESRIKDAVAGVEVIGSSGVRVACNTIEDVRGPIPRGQFVQFNTVVGGDNQIRCNVGRNTPGRGNPEDAISLYKTRGTAERPVTVAYNLVVGGGPSASGGGIMLGDSGGAYQVARANTLVDPGQYGVAVSSGEHMTIADNLVLARSQPFTNVGIYVWNQYPQPCNTISVEGNKVRWFSKTGRPNPYWDGKNCTSITGVTRNDFAADLSPAIADAKVPECQCRTAGRR